jgi:hypothetical protein
MRHVICALTAMILAGCTLHYVPNPSSEELIVVPAFKPGQPVTIINKTAPSDTRLPIGPYDLQVDFRRYADSVVQLLQTELTNRGGVLEGSSSREIRFDITDVRIDQGAGRQRCVINFTIGTGDGYLRGLQAIGVSWNYETAIDRAIVEVVKAILTNERVRKYVSE